MKKTLLAVSLLCLTAPVWAHKINLFVNVEGDQVDVMGYFADGKTPQQVPITVFDMDEQLLLEGKTNDDGEFTFTLPKKESLKVVIDAGLGHVAEYVIPEEDILGDELVVNAVEEVTDAATSSPASGSVPITGNQRELQRIVEKAVARANRPLMLKLDKAQKKARLSDILGGIGLIFGALGAWFFLQARKLQDASRSDANTPPSASGV